eukprot:1159796-Pelagomonas_calceolata.AAC.1
MRGSGRGFGDDAGDLFGSDQVETAEEQQTNVDTVRRKNSTKERPNENWKETGPKMRCDLLSMAPQYALWHQEECTGKKVVLQSRIDSAFKFHTVNCDKCSVQPEAYKLGAPDKVLLKLLCLHAMHSVEHKTTSLVVSSYQAVYNGVDFAFPLLIPVWRCLGCQQEFLPQPIHVGCFGSTPIRPHTWFDLKLFHQYAVLFRHGTSCTAWRVLALRQILHPCKVIGRAAYRRARCIPDSWLTTHWIHISLVAPSWPLDLWPTQQQYNQQGAASRC